MAQRPDRLSSVCSPESPEPLYRYSYTRTRAQGLHRATVILYNPVHRGEKTDPTTGKCMTWLCSDGEIGEVVFVNLFAYRHADPIEVVRLARAGIDVVGPENDDHIKEAVARSVVTVLAWGANATKVAAVRASEVLAWIERPYCFGLNGDGSPIHPNRRGNGRTLRPALFATTDRGIG